MSNPVSKTAWYCTGVRMLDAHAPDSLLHDEWAERFMGDEGRAVFEPFRELYLPNRSNAVRHHLIDEVLRARLAANPQHGVVLLGAGFDARAFRLTGGQWLEIDEAPIIARKEAIAPAAGAPNPLRRMAIDFAHEKLAETLLGMATDDPVTVVMEGVIYYLDPAAVAETLRTLQRLFPRHELVCDLQTDRFVRGWGRPIISRIQQLGATYRFHPANPAAHIETLGYRLRNATSVPLKAAELKRIRLPAWVIRRLLPSLHDGYRVCVFDRRS
jgi:methyltransferase (TIGR00027 family)